VNLALSEKFRELSFVSFQVGFVGFHRQIHKKASIASYSILIRRAEEPSNYMMLFLPPPRTSPSIVRVIKARRMRWAGHVARMGEVRGAYNILVEGKASIVYRMVGENQF
jgi:hypothetical protein